LKIRLDELLVQRQLAASLKQAQAMIGAGQVYVDETCSDKAGNIHNHDAGIRIKQKCSYVSRGGLKLEKSLSRFQLDITGFICADIGASSGGFSDCLLQHGAARVYAVDVAYGQFSWKLRQDPRVVVLERFNARNLTKEEIPESLDLAVIDASFISLTTLIPPLLPLFKENVTIIALIKPQFELPKELVERGGVVKKDQSHQQAIDTISQFSANRGLEVEGLVESPILGPKGNKEFLIHLSNSRK
jgi:23S rRNA (cytidine1920-2'-O)/16S rRNA (cytidine1409-2'-O)-methyltransferase